MDCCCGNPEGTNKECERCRLIAEIARLQGLLDRVKGFANKMSRSGAADRCRAGNDMLELLAMYDDESFIIDNEGDICDEHRFGLWEPADDGTGTYFKTCTVCGHREECPF